MRLVLTGSASGRCWAVPSPDRLRELASEVVPAVPRLGQPRREMHRDLYLDTPDGVLRARGATCRFRVSTSGRASLSLELQQSDGEVLRVDSPSHTGDALQAVSESNRTTRRLRGIADPARLVVRLELEVERLTRDVSRGWLRPVHVRVHYDIVQVRLGESARGLQQVTVHAPLESADADALRQHFEVAAALMPAQSTLERAELLAKWMPRIAHTQAADGRGDSGLAAGEATIDPELSFLASQLRVLAMAEDSHVPLAERLRFIAIVAANLDEFFMVRVAGIKLSSPEVAEEANGEHGDPELQLRAVAAAARELQARQYRAARACVAAAARAGAHVRRWSELTAAQREHLTSRYQDEMHPALTPLAMTMSPGHPFPRVPHLALSMAVVLQGRSGGSHLAEIEIPEDLPRLVPVSPDGSSHDVILLEDIIRANLHRLYPDARIQEAHCFRLTRASEMSIDEAHGSDMLQAMDDATRRRADVVVRVEVDRAMPELLRDLVLAQVSRESGSALPPMADDVYGVDGILDLRVLGQLQLPPESGFHYPELQPRVPMLSDTTLFDAIDAAGEVVVHHPFESFDATVARFIREAATDDAVSTIKMTLYRVGDDSPIVDALRTAAKRGKQVYAFVELRARFDEERNVRWVRALEKAGVHVVYGLVGLKTHAKAALVVRREGSRLRGYVHVGTGNYNARTGLAYTDLSLFTCDANVVSDIVDLFNSLTGSSHPLQRRDRRCLIAPEGMLAGLLDLIAREAALARGGSVASVRIKVNGLSDGEVVTALERAAADGVHVDLIVRGICTLRPAPEGTANRINVVAHTGRFLEHSRIYHFGNAGDDLYFVGSADLRPRNLRRRVEVLAPVTSAAGRRRLNGLLSQYLDDPFCWGLRHDGTYVQRSTDAPGVQEVLVNEVSDDGLPKAKWQHALNGSAR